MKEYEGDWFLPNQYGERVSGILTIDDENQSLSLELYSIKEIVWDDFEDQILHGLDGLDKITLLYCDIISSEEIGWNFFKSKFRPQYAFVGCHFNSFSEIKFASISVNYTYLENWCGIGSETFFNLQHLPDKSIVAKYSPGGTFTVKLNDECDLVISSNCIRTNASALALDTKTFATFSFKEHQPFNKFLDLIHKFKEILTLFLERPVELISQYGLSDNALEGQRHYIKREDAPISIYNDYGKKKKVEKKFVNQNEILINIRKFNPAEIQKIIIAWFDKYEQFEPVYDIFFFAVEPFWERGSLTMRNVAHNNAFLNVLQALEVYHRNKTSIAPDNSEFNAQKEKIIKKAADCLDQEQKMWIMKNAKQNKHDFSLQERINQLIKNKTAFDFIKSDIAYDLKSLRDQLTHVNHSRSTDIDPITLKLLFNKAQIILLGNIFLDLGIEAKKVNDILYSTELYRQLETIGKKIRYNLSIRKKSPASVHDKLTEVIEHNLMKFGEICKIKLWSHWSITEAVAFKCCFKLPQTYSEIELKNQIISFRNRFHYLHYDLEYTVTNNEFCIKIYQLCE